MEKEVLSPTIGRKIITGDKAMVAQVFLAKGAVVPEHHHESEQITYILEGALEFHLEGLAEDGIAAPEPVTTNIDFREDDPEHGVLHCVVEWLEIQVPNPQKLTVTA